MVRGQNTVRRHLRRKVRQCLTKRPEHKSSDTPERPSPFRQRVIAPDVVHQDVEPARFGTDLREVLLLFGFDRVVGAYGNAPAPFRVH